MANVAGVFHNLQAMYPAFYCQAVARLRLPGALQLNTYSHTHTHLPTEASRWVWGSGRL